MTDHAAHPHRQGRTRANPLRWFLPDITDPAEARDAQRAGALGGLMLIGMLVSSFVFADASGASQIGAAEQAARVTLAGLLTWRVLRGGGLFAPLALLAWVSLAAIGMLAAGTMNPAWAFALLLAMVSLAGSLRATRALRRMGIGR